MRNALILEDVPATARWLEQRLKAALGQDIQTRIFHTLAAARAGMAGETDLSILDLGLPDGSGLELIADLQAQNPCVRILVATIYDDDQHIFNALKTGICGYLLKDQHDSDIEKALQGMMQGIPAISPAIARRMMAHFSQPAPPPEPGASLSPRETDVLILIGKGLNIAEAAQALGLSVHTVRGYVKDVYRKLDITSRAEAGLKASSMGLIRP